MSWTPADAKNGQSTSKLSCIPILRAKPFKGDILWQFDFFNKVTSMICIGCHVGGHDFAFQHGSQNNNLLACIIVTLKFAVNTTTTSFKHFS